MVFHFYLFFTSIFCTNIHSLGGLGPFLGRPWAVLGRPGALLLRSWGDLGVVLGRLGSSWIVLGRSWAVLRYLGALLGRSWGDLGVVSGRLGSSWVVLERPWAVLGRLGALLHCSCFLKRKSFLWRPHNKIPGTKKRLARARDARVREPSLVFQKEKASYGDPT